jgi:hypothetical protein
MHIELAPEAAGSLLAHGAEHPFSLKREHGFWANPSPRPSSICCKWCSDSSNWMAVQQGLLRPELL